MPSYRVQRTNEDIMREITALLREMKDPRVSEALLSVVKTDTDSDLSGCKVYISSLRGMDAAKQAVKVLSRCEGHMRHELVTRLHLRHAPELFFIADDSIEHSAHIAQILESLGGEHHDNDTDNENGED